MRICFVTFLSIAILIHHKTNAQDPRSAKKIKILPVPTFGYTPETNTYIGAVSLFTLNFYNDSITRSSNAKIELNYTWNEQLILETQWNYFFRHEIWYARGLFRVSKYPDFYYGIGPASSEADEINFQSNRTIVDMEILRKVKHKLFAGLGIRYFNYHNIDFFEDPNPYAELKSASSFGLKIIVLNDARNNILNPSGGNYVELITAINKSDDYYGQLSLDLRKYYSIQKGRSHTIATRLYNSFVFSRPPFYDYSLMGGDRFVRGYFYGRFRDKHLSTLQLEYRLDLLWRFGLATFGGLSMIYPDFSEIANDSFKPNAGIGLRFLVDKAENTNLRLDYAIGSNGESGFYISFGESF